jgi:hypothetical protein
MSTSQFMPVIAGPWVDGLLSGGHFGVVSYQSCCCGVLERRKKDYAGTESLMKSISCQENVFVRFTLFWEGDDRAPVTDTKSPRSSDFL